MSDAIETEKISVSLVRACPLCKKQFSSSGTKFCPDDNSLLAPVQQDPLVGTKVAHNYTVDELIALGGWGRVYKGTHTTLQNLSVAIKTLHPFLASDADKVRRFQQEAEAASRLNHPNIIRVLDYGLLENGQPYLIMDFAKGLTLGKMLKADGKLSVPETVEVGLQCASALVEAHAHGVIHRDIKPSNIIVHRDNSGHPVANVVDFGLAKLTLDNDGNTLTGSGEVIGTPAYMSPEQCSGQPIDTRSDIYSLGCILYEMVAGKPAIDASNYLECMAKHVNEVPKTFSELGVADVPVGLEKIIFRCLAKKPEDRFQSANDLVAALKVGDIEDVPGKSKHAPRGNKQALKAILIGATCLTFIAGAGMWTQMKHAAPEPAPVATVQSLLAAADRQEEQQLYPEEEGSLHKAYLLAKQKFGEQSKEVQQVTHALGAFYLRQDKLNRATALLEKSADLQAKLAPQEGSALAAAYTELADAYRRDAQSEPAERATEKALSYMKSAVGNQHPTVADLMLQLSALKMERSEPAEALALTEHAVAILEKSAAPSDRKLLEGQRQLALLYEQDKRQRDAESTIARALANSNHQSEIGRKIFSSAASIAAESGKFQQAEKYSREAFAISEAIDAKRSIRSSEAGQLASILEREGKIAEADDWYEKSTTLNPRDTSAQKQYADFLTRHGKKAEAKLVTPADPGKLLSGND